MGRLIMNQILDLFIFEYLLNLKTTCLATVRFVPGFVHWTHTMKDTHRPTIVTTTGCVRNYSYAQNVTGIMREKLDTA